MVKLRTAVEIGMDTHKPKQVKGQLKSIYNYTFNELINKKK